MVLKGPTFIVMDYYPRSLHNYIQFNVTPFTINFIQNIMRQLLSALAALHERRVIHRDIKSINILCTGDARQIALADFGISREFCIPFRTYTKEVATIDHRAIELLLGCKAYTTAIDIWAVGCVFIHLCEGKCFGSSLDNGTTETGFILEIFRVFGTPNTEPYFTKLPSWQPGFPNYPPANLAEVFPKMAQYPHAIDFLSVRSHFGFGYQRTANNLLI